MRRRARLSGSSAGGERLVAGDRVEWLWTASILSCSRPCLGLRMSEPSESTMIPPPSLLPELPAEPPSPALALPPFPPVFPSPPDPAVAVPCLITVAIR